MIYVNEFCSVQLLTQQQETDIAKRREAGESQMVESNLSTPRALQLVLQLEGKTENDEVRLSDVVEGRRQKTLLLGGYRISIRSIEERRF